MRAIWKTVLDLMQPAQMVRFPDGARLLTVQMQRNANAPASECATAVQGESRTHLVLWAEVDPAAPIVSRLLSIYGTGWPMPDDPGIYIGTAQDEDGLVWHVYERPAAAGAIAFIQSLGGGSSPAMAYAYAHEEATA